MILLSNYVVFDFDGLWWREKSIFFWISHASVEFFRVFLHLFQQISKGNFWLQFSNVFSETGDSAWIMSHLTWSFVISHDHDLKWSLMILHHYMILHEHDLKWSYMILHDLLSWSSWIIAPNGPMVKHYLKIYSWSDIIHVQPSHLSSAFLPLE